MYEITRRLEWDAGHRVPLHKSKCKTPHGHRYVAEITCRAGDLTPEGFVIDFGVVKQEVGAWIDENWDHTMIYQAGDGLMEVLAADAAENGLRPFYSLPYAPTAENMAKHLFETATVILARHHCAVTSVTIWETPNCRAVWRG